MAGNTPPRTSFSRCRTYPVAWVPVIPECCKGTHRWDIHADPRLRISCPPEIWPRKTVSTADIPCPKAQPIQAERPARIWREPCHGFRGTCAILRWSQPRVWRFDVRRVRLAIVQRIAGHRTVFHAGRVSPADSRNRTALARNVERPSRFHLLKTGSRNA